MKTDLDAIRARLRLAQGAELSFPSSDEIISRWQAWEQDVPALLALVDRMLPVLEAAQALIAKRNEAHDNPSNPEWWQGYDWGLVRAVVEYEKAEDA